MNSTIGNIDIKLCAECYQLFAACFYLPEPGLFDETGQINRLRQRLGNFSEELKKELGIMKETGAGMQIEDLRIEYSRLFIGPFTLPCPPYGSVYLDRDRRVMGDTTMEVIELYKQEGLEINQTFRDLPDHIAVELEYMYYLLYYQIQAESDKDVRKAESYYKKQQHFYTRFILQWVPDFCSRIKSSTQNKYYHRVAEALTIFLDLEKNRLASGMIG